MVIRCMCGLVLSCLWMVLFRWWLCLLLLVCVISRLVVIVLSRVGICVIMFLLMERME